MAKKNDQLASTASPFKVQNLHLKEINIEELIYVIRGQRVMIDSDLAKLYNEETKYLKRSVRTHIKRFPDDFMFELTKEEYASLRCKSSTLKSAGRGQHSKYLPYAFTKNGIAMLSSVLDSDTAIEANIYIMRAFTKTYNLIPPNSDIYHRMAAIEHHQIETDKQINEVIRRLDAKVSPAQGIFYDGQVFDAYQFVCGLVRSATNNIVLIDNYVDETVLTLLDKRDSGVTATIYTQYISQQLQLDITKHNAQYPPIKVERFNHAHDRFLLIDDAVYHIGASIKDLGRKWFAFTKMQDITTEELLSKI
ncbi:MAG: ORF6N domain-containing protein [Prevotella sp.]|nr:ORF6N domain-containing protein [Prevotella sp.]